MRHLRILLLLQIGSSVMPAYAVCQEISPAAVVSSPPVATRPSSYILGPDDVIAIKGLDAEEINSPSLRIDHGGSISLPLLGHIAAGGLSVEQLEKDIAARLATYVRNPEE